MDSKFLCVLFGQAKQAPQRSNYLGMNRIWYKNGFTEGTQREILKKTL